MHRHGTAETKIGTQLAHAGRKASSYWPFSGKMGSVPASEGGWDTVGPGTGAFDGYAPPSAMTEAQIDGVIADFAAAAVRAVDAGFDTIEIHGAHGYLLHQFQSPLVNDRTDRWGGDEAGRNRLTLAVVDAVRAVIPDSMPLLLRISASDWAPGGIEAEASVRMAAPPRSTEWTWWTFPAAGPLPTSRFPSAPATRPGSPPGSGAKPGSRPARWDS